MKTVHIIGFRKGNKSLITQGEMEAFRASHKAEIENGTISDIRDMGTVILMPVSIPRTVSFSLYGHRPMY